MTDVKQTSGGPAVPTTTLVQCDQISILGDGSHERPLHVGSGGASVAVDGVTILGNGTTGNPLHAGSSDGTFRAAFRGGSLSPLPGMPVFFGAVSVPSSGITTVQPSSATNLLLFGSSVDGIVKSVNGDGTVQVQTAGLLTLTTAQWDAITGGSGGLLLGTRYYLDAFPAFATLTGTLPTLPALFVTQVGIGISATTMQLSLPGNARQNLENLTIVAGFTGPIPAFGSALIVSGNNHAALATSDVSLTNAQAVGVLAAVDNVNGTALIVQLAGVVTLTTAQWDAVTDTVPGMQAGTAYYVDVNARAGNLTAIKPVSGSVTQVGIGLSTTTMILAAPFPLRLS